MQVFPSHNVTEMAELDSRFLAHPEPLKSKAYRKWRASAVEARGPRFKSGRPDQLTHSDVNTTRFPQPTGRGGAVPKVCQNGFTAVPERSWWRSFLLGFSLANASLIPDCSLKSCASLRLSICVTKWSDCRGFDPRPPLRPFHNREHLAYGRSQHTSLHYVKGRFERLQGFLTVIPAWKQLQGYWKAPPGGSRRF